jgi:hypothetical protein
VCCRARARALRTEKKLGLKGVVRNAHTNAKALTPLSKINKSASARDKLKKQIKLLQGKIQRQTHTHGGAARTLKPEQLALLDQDRAALRAREEALFQIFLAMQLK